MTWDKATPQIRYKRRKDSATKPTLDQAGKLLELVSQSGRTDDWVQEHLIGSGAFSDLLEVENLRAMNRDERRRFLGLNPLRPKLLESLGVVTIVATMEFVVRDRFVVDVSATAPVKIRYVSDDFKARFYGKTEKRAGKTKLRRAKLTSLALDGEIRKEIGAKFEETTLAQIDALMELQKNGQSGVLLTNGLANIFYVKDVSGELRAVLVSWNDVGWYVNAYSVTSQYGRDDESQVFSRNS